jgi:hypothetical protein
MISWSSIQRFDASTMTLTDPPQRPQTSISMRMAAPLKGHLGTR